MESKQEQADQNQDTPKLEDTKKSTENRKDTSELSECNVGKLGELKKDSLKPYHSKVKSKNPSEVKIKINQVINIGISKVELENLSKVKIRNQSNNRLESEINKLKKSWKLLKLSKNL